MLRLYTAEQVQPPAQFCRAGCLAGVWLPLHAWPCSPWLQGDPPGSDAIQDLSLVCLPLLLYALECLLARHLKQSPAERCLLPACKDSFRTRIPSRPQRQLHVFSVLPAQRQHELH